MRPKPDSAHEECAHADVVHERMSFGRDKPRQGLQRPFSSGVEDCHCACLQCQLRTIVDLSRNHSHGSDGGELLWVCNHNRQIADHWMNPRGTLARMGWGIKK